MLKPSSSLVFATLLSAHSLAIATPVLDATDSTFNGPDGRHSYRNPVDSSAPCGICAKLTMPIVGASITSTDTTAQAADWLKEGPEADWAGSSAGVPTPQVTIDFVNTVSVNSVIVWRETGFARDDTSLPSRTSASSLNFPVFAGPNRGQRAYALSELNIVESTIGVRFSKLPGTWAMAGEGSFDDPARTSFPKPVIALLLPGILVAVGLLVSWHAN